MPDPKICLEIQELGKEFPTRSGSLSVLKDIEFTLSRGDALAIMGPSGSGKSTLLHIIGTLEPPSSGKVQIEGKDPFELAEPDLAAFRNSSIGFIFQEHHLLPQCSTLENVLIPTLVHAANGQAGPQRAKSLLDRVGLGDRLGHRPAELSGGERQRVAIARALINQPALLLCDEPTGNLDRTNAESMGDLFLALCREEETTLIAVTHSHSLAARFPRKMELLDGLLEEVTS